MRNPELGLTRPAATKEQLRALAQQVPGAWEGLEITALLLALEGQRPDWIAEGGANGAWHRGTRAWSSSKKSSKSPRRCRSPRGSKPGEKANRALRSHPVGTSVSGEARRRQGTYQTNHRNGQTGRDATRGRLCRSELDARGRQGYGFRVEIKLKSEIAATMSMVAPSLLSAWTIIRYKGNPTGASSFKPTAM
jgi:hypothetical protein